MADGLKIRVSFSNSFSAVMEGFARPIASACSAAVIKAGNATKERGRAAIAAQGMSSRWQNALRVNFYPDKLKKPSIDAAAFIFHKIDYSSVFDKPTVISGKPLMWIPIAGSMKSVKGVRSPGALKAKGVDLFSFKGSKTPLLGAAVRGSKKGLGGEVSLAKLKKGTAGKRGTVYNVPLFVGVPRVKLSKSFGIESIARKEAAAIPMYYDAALSVERTGG
jgi:hypothetical protein